MEIIKNSFGPYDRFVEWLPTELVKKFREYDREDGDAEYLDGLTEQIKQNGITEPLILTYSRSTRKALLTEGNHRLAAAIRLGMTEVPVRVCLKEGDFNRGAGVVVPGFDETPYWNEDYKREITPHVPADMRPSDIGVGPFEKTAATPNPARIGAAVKQFCASNESYAILDSLITGGTWLAGGCWILAYALCEGFGGELYGVFAHGIPQHVVAKIGNQFIDGDGASTAAQLLHRWKTVERLPADTYLAPVNPTEVFAADKEMVAPPEEGRKDIISGIQKILGTKTAATAPVDNPAFNSWFSGSEIVNDDGTPKVVYHSTYFNFDEFDRMFPVKKWNRPKSLDRIGIWFSDSSGENGAGMYSSDTGKGSNIIPAYLSMKNPLVFRTNVDGDAFVGLVKLWDRYHEQDKKFPRGTKKDRKQNSRWGDSEGFRDYLKQEGHDGVILKNTRGDSKVPQTMYIVFEPNQIKSAIGNKGTFDPGSNNITASHHDELLNLSWDADDYDKYLALKNVKFPLTVYRAVNIPSETSFRVNEAGECWTWDEKFANSYYGNGKRTPHIIRAVIDSPDKVDWVGTDLQNQQFGWSEKEIRVKVGSDLQFTGWRRADSREWKEPWVKSITAADTTASPVRIGAPPLAQQGITQTPQFKAWFSGSEVVDKQGNPLVMYHATQSDIGEFHAYTHFGTQGAANDRHQNLWDFYNDELKNPTRAQGSNIMPVYLSVKNALRMQDLAGIDDNTGAEIDEAAYATGEEYYPRGWEGEEAIPMTLYEMGIMDIDDFEEHRSNAEALKFLEQQGYDGIVYENVVEDPGNDSWIVFRPNQIKSAVGNSGEFSGGNSVTAANKSQFDTWFAGSKVITKEGAPLKVYHGTRRHFTKPRPLTHFGTRHAAQEAPNYSGVLMEFYLSIKRPFYTVDSAGGQDMWYWLQDAGKKGVITREEFSEWEGTADPLKGVELLESKGYDGIVYENGFEDAGNLSWVIFRSDQAVLVEKINSITAATKMPKFDEVFGQYGMYDEGVWNAPEESFRTVIAHDYDPDAEYGEQSNGWALNPDQRKDNQADNVDVLDAAIVASTHPVKYSYGLVEVVAPESIVGVIPFDEEDLMAKGVETEPHLTARYGILNNKIDGIRELATQYKPFKITLGKTSTFPPSKSSDNAVPVIIEVTSPELHELNAKLGGVADFKPSDFDDYRPHLTLAYVRPEAAEKYTGIDTLEGTEFEVTELVVSDPDDNKTVFPLKIAETTDITASVERPRNEDMEDYVIAYLRQYPKGKPGVSDGLSRPDGSGEIVYRGHDGRVLGVMAYSPTEITDIAVHKDHRTRGIGTTMMEELRKRGISKFRPPMTEAGEAFAKKQAASTNRPLTQDEFYASRLEAYKKSEAENNGWRNSVLIYHGTDSITAEKITQSGRFKSGNDWPSFFTTRKSEATDYARIRAGQVKEHGKDAQPFVFALKVAPYAVHLNKGSGEVETHTGVPLYLDGTTVGYVKDADLIKSFERCNDPYWTYALYLKDYEQQGEASRELAGDAVDPELLAPIIVQGQVTGEKALKDFGFFELLNTYQWLKRKRDKKSKSLYQEVEKWGIRMQNKRKAEMEEREGKTSAVETEPTLLTDSPAFQTWFKGSKVTYTDGVTPQTVFHFTQSDFNIFNTDPRNTPGIILDTIGAWFTPSPNLANQVYGFYQDNRAVNRRGNPQVMYCYLSIKNPLITENRHYLWDVIQTKMCGSDMDRIKKFRADALRDQVQFVKDVKKQLVQQGYDGIFIENDYYGPAWVAFFPNQVKSALANNGNFSPEVHDITASEDDLKDFINSAEEHQPLAEAKTSSLKNPLMSKKTKK